MATKIQLRRDTAANWETSNPVLSQGEPGLAIDTNTVKYGDGVTDWKSLPASTDYAMTASSGNQWQYRTTSGGTSFTYVIAGNINTQFTVPLAQEGAEVTSISIDVATHQTITSVQQALTNYNNTNGPRPFFTINDDTSGYVTGYSLAAGIVTLTLDTDYAINEGDQVTIFAWTKGTQGIYPRYSTRYGPGGQYSVSNNGYHWGPIADASNTNTVTVDFNGEDSNYINALLANPYRSYIVFDQYTKDSSAVIKTATRVGTSNNYTLTFDGPPRDLFAKSQVTLDCNMASNVTDGYHLLLNSTTYPQLVDFLYTSGNQYAPEEAYFTINNDTTRYYVGGFWPRGGGTGATPGLNSEGNWSIQINDMFTATVQDTIHLHYTKAGTFIRMDYYTPDISYDTNQTEDNNVYRWFSWEDNLPFYKASHGNGVQGGWLDFHIQCSWPKTKSSMAQDNKTVSVFFDPRGTTYGNALNSLNATTSFQGNIYNDRFGYHVDFRPIYDFYEGGIFFKADYSDSYPGSLSQEIKVDIIWNARLFYGDDPTYEYWP